MLFWQVFFLFLNNMIRLRVFGCKQFHDNVYFNSIRKRSNRIDDVYFTLMHQIGSLDSFIQLLKYSVVLGCVPPFWKDEFLRIYFFINLISLISFRCINMCKLRIIIYDVWLPAMLTRLSDWQQLHTCKSMKQMLTVTTSQVNPNWPVFLFD